MHFDMQLWQLPFEGEWPTSVTFLGSNRRLAAANQEGTHAANNIRRLLDGTPTRHFEYFNKGELATIGRNRAIAVFGDVRFAGFPAWLLWLFVHIMYLVGFRNRVIVLVEWAHAWFTFQRGVRLLAAER